ncbi:MAG: TRAP transporter large permease subunit [Alphaproteobacteria bacterium]|nr:TRAP transporter large permease subunit [Alphaproteobacteria bacterium]
MAVDLALLFGVMLAAMAVGMPVFLAMALSAGAYWLVFPAKLPLAVIGQTFAQGIDSYSFAAIPFFFLAGEVMNTGGISRRLLRLARAMLGHVQGGLAHVNIATNMVFAGVSGSAVADASAVGAVMIPAMRREGYPAAYAAAVTAAAATIGPVIPPSIPMVIFGLLAGTSIGKLFVGGVVPGLLMGVFLLAASWLIARRRGFPAGRWSGFRELFAAAIDAALAVLTPFIVIGGLVFGVATTTEIGAVAARSMPSWSARYLPRDGACGRCGRYARRYRFSGRPTWRRPPASSPGCWPISAPARRWRAGSAAPAAIRRWCCC